MKRIYAIDLPEGFEVVLVEAESNEQEGDINYPKFDDITAEHEGDIADLKSDVKNLLAFVDRAEAAGYSE